MLAANQYFLSGVPANASLEQFLVQQGANHHLGLGLGQAAGDAGSGLAAPPALHHGHPAPQQQQQQQPPQQQQQQPPQQQLQPHALSHSHAHAHPHALPHGHSHHAPPPPHGLHPGPQPSPLGGFDFQGIPVLSSNQLASLIQQEAGLPLPLPLHLPLPKDEPKADSGGGGRRKKAMAGYLPQRKAEGGAGQGDPGASGAHAEAGPALPGLGADPSGLLSSSSASSSSSVVSSSSAPSSSSSSAAASVLVPNGGGPPLVPKAEGASLAAAQPEPEPLYHCGECGKTFTHLSSLRRHLRSHGLAGGPGPSDASAPHSTQDLAGPPAAPPPPAPPAHPAPTSSSSCSSPEKTHRCPECGKGFKKRGHLLQHSVIHSGARPFACAVCQRAFNRRESLTRHEKIHEDKPYRCPACGRCFRESTSLLNHAASGTCGKPGRGARAKAAAAAAGAELTIGSDGRYGRKPEKARPEFAPGAAAGAPGLAYGKVEEEEAEEEAAEDKAGLACEVLFQQSRAAAKLEGKLGPDFPRGRYQDFRADYKRPPAAAAAAACFPGEPLCGGAGPALRKAPLAPTLHPHPHPQGQGQPPHLPLSSLLDEAEDDVTSSVNSAISAIAAAAAASCLPGELGGGRGAEERRDIIGGLLGNLGLGALGVPAGGPSSTSGGPEKAYRAGAEDGGSSCSSAAPPAKPKRPRKPRPKKEPGAAGEPGRRRPGGAAGSERLFLCSVCGRGFTRRETLRRHDRIHTGEKPHRCPVCGKHFREAFHLTKHRTVHSGEKNYKCAVCGKDFGYAQSLKRHGKLHQKAEYAETPVGPAAGGEAEPGADSYFSFGQPDKPQAAAAAPRLYTCAICWKSFRHHFHLTAHHQAVHEGGERLFCCEVCGKAFAYANSLTRHRLAQHGLARAGPRAAAAPAAPSESEAATHALLQLAPPAAGSQTAPAPPAGFPPLFYLPDAAPPPDSTQLPAVKGEPSCPLAGPPPLHTVLLLPAHAEPPGGAAEAGRRKRRAKRKRRRQAEGGRARKRRARLRAALDAARHKRFPCPFCPRTTFRRQAALLLHRAARHPAGAPRAARRRCPVCGRCSRRFLRALAHRGRHLAQGAFACARCPARFWNGSLLERHGVACRGARAGAPRSRPAPSRRARTARSPGASPGAGADCRRK